MSTIACIGASGNVGRLVVAQALAQGHTVRALQHHTPITTTHENLVCITGSSNDPTALTELCTNCDAVIVTLSSWKAHGTPVVTEAITTLIQVLPKCGNPTLVTLTGADAWVSGDNPDFVNRLSHLALSLIAGPVLSDGEQHLAALTKSTLRWKCLRSPRMVRASTKEPTLTTKLISPFASVSRSAVAETMLALALGEDHLHQPISIYQ